MATTARIRLYGYRFHGFFSASEIRRFQRRPGVYIIACGCGGASYDLEIGETADVQSRLLAHPGLASWQKGCKCPAVRRGPVYFAAFYCPEGGEHDRKELVAKIRGLSEAGNRANAALQRTPLVLHPYRGDMAMSPPGEVPLYVVCTQTDPRYGFSLTRFSDESSIEFMVEDQTNMPTFNPKVRLYLDRLTLRLTGDDAALAREIGIPLAYTVLLRVAAKRMLKLDAVLAQIFAGIGDYRRQF